MSCRHRRGSAQTSKPGRRSSFGLATAIALNRRPMPVRSSLVRRTSAASMVPAYSGGAAALSAAAPPEYAGTIDAALVRLTSEDRTGMGRLFKAIAVANPKLDLLPGFEV